MSILTIGKTKGQNMKSFTMGLTPEDVIRESLPEFYPMELNYNDYALFAKLVNIGIDSRLQAIFINDAAIKNVYGKAKIELSKDSMVCLLNRLFDYSTFGSAYSNLLDIEESENALSLRSSILSTIEIEEV